MKSLLHYTWKKLASLPKDKTILFLTVAPIEEHSLHLPIGVDILLGQHWQKQTIEHLNNQYPDYHFISMPFIPIASGSMLGFPGCIYIKPKLIRKLMEKILTNIASWGEKNLVIVASHGDPFHNMAIEKACDKVNKRLNTNFISPMGALFSHENLGIDLELGDDVNRILKKYPNDFHAGWMETSMMLDIYPELVSEYSSIPDITVTEVEMVNAKKYSQKTKGYGHLGYPQHSKPELGKTINQSTIKYLILIAEKIIKKENLSLYTHHYLNKIPFLKLMV